MEKENIEYVVRDFSAIDKHVEEMAKRERILTWRLRIENFKRLGLPLIMVASALSILIVALGIFIWFLKKEKIVEIDKIVEITKEVPVITEKIKEVEVPIYIEVPKFIKIETITTKQSDNFKNFSPATDIMINNNDETTTISTEVEEILKKNNLNIGATLNFALLWKNKNDLDLHIQTPSGKIINWQRKSLDGGVLDFDKNLSEYNLTSKPIENIKWNGDVLKGNYKAYVSIYSNRDQTNLENTPFKLIIHKNKEAIGSFSGQIKNSSQKNYRQLITEMKYD